MNEEKTQTVEEVKKPKVVVVVGNGFDLDLGYPTSYNDFVESKWFKALLYNDNIPTELILEGKYEDNMQIYPNKLAVYINQIKEHNNWVDLEEAIAQYAITNHTYATSNIVLREVKALKFFLYQYISRLERKLPSIRNYSNKVSYRLLSELVQNDIDIQIWTFNYTFYCERVIEENKSDFNYINNRVHYIHGNLLDANQDKFSLVLGCEYSNQVYDICPSLMKSNTIQNYREKKQLLNEHMKEAENIIFMGHSVGSTDQQYFKNILDSKKIKALTIITNTENSCNNVLRNINRITKEKFGQMQEDAKISCLTFVSEGYYLSVGGFPVVNNEKENEYVAFLDNIINGRYK